MRTPGGLFTELCYNDEFWLDARQKVHKISEMDPEYIIAIYKKLKKEQPKYLKSGVGEIIIPGQIEMKYLWLKENNPELFL